MRVDDPVSERVIGACIEVHRYLGPGLLESIYEECLCRELDLAGMEFLRQVVVPVEYKGLHIDVGYRLDLVVQSKLVVELKTVSEIAPIHLAQLLTYLKLTNLPTGLLINFNVPILRYGIRRITTPSIDRPLKSSSLLPSSP
ncbi:MAG TPA: GxxExxY protein [Polyangia bacterium]|nr:GxxExxY protein [Polyangia bacterium]